MMWGLEERSSFECEQRAAERLVRSGVSWKFVPRYLSILTADYAAALAFGERVRVEELDIAVDDCVLSTTPPTELCAEGTSIESGPKEIDSRSAKDGIESVTAEPDVYPSGWTLAESEEAEWRTARVKIEMFNESWGGEHIAARRNLAMGLSCISLKAPEATSRAEICSNGILQFWSKVARSCRNDAAACIVARAALRDFVRRVTVMEGLIKRQSSEAPRSEGQDDELSEAAVTDQSDQLAWLQGLRAALEKLLGQFEGGDQTAVT